MKFTRKNLLCLLIFGIMLIGGYKLLNFDAHTDEYTTVPQTVEVLADQVSPAAKNWIMIGENALPNIPCRIYVLKTASRAEIWHMSAITRSENGKLSLCLILIKVFINILRNLHDNRKNSNKKN